MLLSHAESLQNKKRKLWTLWRKGRKIKILLLLPLEMEQMMLIWLLLLILESVFLGLKGSRLPDQLISQLDNSNFSKIYCFFMVEKHIEEIVIWFCTCFTKIWYLFFLYSILDFIVAFRDKKYTINFFTNHSIYFSQDYQYAGIAHLTSNMRNKST